MSTEEKKETEASAVVETASVEEGKQKAARRPRRTRVEVIDGKIEALEEKKARYQAEIDKIDKEIADLEAKRAEKPATLQDVKAAMQQAQMTPEDLISMIKQRQIGE